MSVSVSKEQVFTAVLNNKCILQVEFYLFISKYFMLCVIETRSMFAQLRGWSLTIMVRLFGGRRSLWQKCNKRQVHSRTRSMETGSLVKRESLEGTIKHLKKQTMCEIKWWAPLQLMNQIMETLTAKILVRKATQNLWRASMCQNSAQIFYLHNWCVHCTLYTSTIYGE